jgi:hypothetical protein
MADEMITPQDLEAVISKLHSERQAHLDAIAEIDRAFARVGIKPGGAKRRGRPPAYLSKGPTPSAGRKKGKRGRRRKRRTFEVSGEQSVLDFVKSAGKKGVMTNDIVGHWESEGRAGGAYTTIGKLVKDKKIKKENIKGERGSRYIAR